MNQDNTNRKKYIPWMFIPCVLAFVLQFAASIIIMEGGAAYALGTFSGKSLDELLNYMFDVMLSNTTNDFIYILYSATGIIIFLTCYNRMFMEGKTYSFKGISKNTSATIGGVVLFCIGMQYVSIYLMNALASAFPSWLEEYEAIMESAGFEDEMTIALALYALLLGPVVEELIFRGLTLSAAKKVMPYYFAIIVQALLFGAFHMNAIQSCYAFVLGLGLGYIMHLYDNILLTIAIHIIYNIIGTIGSEILPVGGDTLISFFIWVLGALIISYLGIILLRKGAASVKEDEHFADI